MNNNHQVHNINNLDNKNLLNQLEVHHHLDNNLMVKVVNHEIELII
jgi:hypothetical protein